MNNILKLERITKGDDAHLEELIQLYKDAFPISERRDIDQLKWLVETRPDMYFNMIVSDSKLAGLCVYWDLEDFYYLEHLAIFQEMRGGKIGGQLLNHIKHTIPGTHLLEVEPTADELTTRRIGFYERNGYQIVDREYMQPSYRARIKDEYPLWIMSNCKTPHLKKFTERIKEEIYYSLYNWNR